MQETYEKLKEKIPSIDEFLDLHECKYPIRRAMIKLQLRKDEDKTPYLRDERDLARRWYFFSGNSYRRMIKAGLKLPSESSVRRWIVPYSVEPGNYKKVVYLLSDVLSKLPIQLRICLLKFDAMKIKKFEEFCKMYDLVEGLMDLGELGRFDVIATEVLVFCLDSLNHENRWRQPIAYFFTGDGFGGEQLSELIKLILREIQITNIIVKGLVTDEYSVNENAFLNLMGPKKSIHQNYFTLDNIKYFIIFDFPHIIKRFAYHLRTYNCIYKKNKIIVNFNDLYATYKLDQSGKLSNLLSNLNESNFFPTTFQSMNVARAFRLFSHSMATSIKTAGKKIF